MSLYSVRMILLRSSDAADLLGEVSLSTSKMGHLGMALTKYKAVLAPNASLPRMRKISTSIRVSDYCLRVGQTSRKGVMFNVC